MQNLLVILSALIISSRTETYSPLEKEVQAWLDWYNTTAEKQHYPDTLAQWTYKTNVTDYNNVQLAKASNKLKMWLQEQANKARKFNLSQIRDERTRRLLQSISSVGVRLPDEENFFLSTLIGNMTAIYNKNPICAWKEGKPDCSVKWDLEPEITDVLAESRDYDELMYVWEAWRDATKSAEQYYPDYVRLQNKGTQADGFKDTGDYWRSSFETPDLQEQVEAMLHDILPLYEQIHTYVRRHLMAKYPGRFTTSAIPAHILGNMWAQEWQNLFDFTQPYTGKSAIDVTKELKAQNFDAIRMFHTADDFFASLGLKEMPEPFWKETMFVKPKDRIVVCHASAWDFLNRHDYRIKMCTSITHDDLITIHHEMGHVEYYLNFAIQPVSFRSGANPGFNEAIGDTIALSVSTPSHLQKIGLLKNYTYDKEQDLNYLFKQAMEKVMFVPFSYVVDYWRWKVFDGTYTKKNWNDAWWKLKFNLQGVVPPRPCPSDAFDPAAKSHILSNTPYIRYFVSYNVQFQFYKAMCRISGHTGPLHQCDFYKNKQAGKAFSEMLKLGSSKPWPDAMEKLTGERKMHSKALLEYFNPIHEWLVEKNKEASDCYGWGADDYWPPEVLANLPTPRCGKEYKKTDQGHHGLPSHNEIKDWFKEQAREACYQCKFCQKLCKEKGIGCCDF